MQDLINEYFKKIYDDELHEGDEEIIGKVKDITKFLDEQCEYVNDTKNDIDTEIAENIVEEAKGLLKEIKEKYPNENDVVKIFIHPMIDFYVLAQPENLLEDLKEEMGESTNGN